jgi:hypothetical protein
VAHERVEEARVLLLVVAEGAQEGEEAEAALAGDAGAGGDVLAGLLLDVELDPLAAVGVDRAGDELVLRQVPEPEPLPGWKMTPGLRTSWETTTRSVPLMMNVPLSVIIGKSPMKTVCSLISPVEAFMKRARTKIGAEKVMSFSLHSSTLNLGGGRGPRPRGRTRARGAGCPRSP